MRKPPRLTIGTTLSHYSAGYERLGDPELYSFALGVEGSNMYTLKFLEAAGIIRNIMPIKAMKTGQISQVVFNYN